MNKVENFHNRFLQSELINPNDYFQDFDTNELSNIIRELAIQREILKKVTDDIDRFIIYGKKSIKIPELNCLPTRNSFHQSPRFHSMGQFASAKNISTTVYPS